MAAERHVAECPGSRQTDNYSITVTDIQVELYDKAHLLPHGYVID
jgi:hypothetical protein